MAVLSRAPQFRTPPPATAQVAPATMRCGMYRARPGTLCLDTASADAWFLADHSTVWERVRRWRENDQLEIRGRHMPH